MSESLDSLTDQQLLAMWKLGKTEAADRLFHRYAVRLAALASRRMNDRLRTKLDADDVVASAMRSFFIGAANGRFADDRSLSLWSLLAKITLRKVSKQVDYFSAKRRSISRESESIDVADLVERTGESLETSLSAFEETLTQITSGLTAKEQRVLDGMLQGQSQHDISIALDCSERTVRRAVDKIRTRTGAIIGSEVSLSHESKRHTPPQAISKHLDCLPKIDQRDIQLHHMISQGGISKVYAADYQQHQSVAVKFLRKSFWHDHRTTDRFISELVHVWNLRHPCVPRFIGWGQTQHGGLFLVLERINGPTLLEKIRGTTMIVREKMHVLLDVANVLQEVHEAGIIHGDLSPANIVCAKNRIVLLDFGFAVWHRHPIQLAFGGTEGFIAPEQLSEAFGQIGPTCDVFGFGSLAYFLLSGLIPPCPLTTAEPKPHQSGLVDPLTNQLWILVSRCRRQFPSERIQSMSPIIATLKRLISNPDEMPT